MSRPLRIEFAGALYHVTSRGDRQRDIFTDNVDRRSWLDILGRVCARHNFVVHGYCQMTNHYHIILETVDGNLAQGMHALNAIYSQFFNRRHEIVGHVLQGRYKAILVQRETYLLELIRYVVLNPLRAGIVKSPEAWPWSSHAGVIGTAPTPSWLHTSSVLQHFASSQQEAIDAYQKFVAAGIGASSPLENIRHQLILGDNAFVDNVKAGIAHVDGLASIPRLQRQTASLTLQEYEHRYPNRDEAMTHAYLSTVYTMGQIGEHFHVSAKTVSRAIKRMENDQLVSECRT